MRNKTLLFVIIISFFDLKGQELEKTTFGVQYKPIVPAKYFNTSDISQNYNSYNLILSPKYSSSFGMIIRHKINNTFSIESALNYTKRNYKLNINNKVINLNDLTNFSIRSYEIPLQLLIYVRASKYWFLNVAFGISHNVLASDIISYGEKDNDYFQNTYRKNGGYRALLANVGMEYKTEQTGCYYIGASLHRPWGEIGRIYPEYSGEFEGQNQTFNNVVFEDKFFLDIVGSFLTIDLRYFFPTQN